MTMSFHSILYYLYRCCSIFK